MATYVEDSVRVQITVLEEAGELYLLVHARAFVGPTETRSRTVRIPVSSLSAGRQAGITDLMADAVAMAKAEFSIP